MMNQRVAHEGARGVYLFARKLGKKASLGDCDPEFQDYMEKALKLRPELFSKAVSINKYSIWRSLYRGVTIEAENKNIVLVAIEFINRWRKKEGARGAKYEASLYFIGQRSTLAPGCVSRHH